MSPEGAARRSTQSDTAQGGLGVVSIGKSYRGRRVVKDVSLTVNRGEVVGLLGPNGAGKTTCFYMITGLVRVDQGQILLDGQDVTTLPMYQRARLGVGYLPQEPSIFRGLTVEQNVMAIVELSERNSSKRRDIVDGLLAELRVDHLRDSPLQPFRAASGAGWKLRGLWRRGRRSCCSMSLSPASTRSPSTTSES
jgi:lipopolysaccharide export system ATP-binding protein